MIVVRPIFFSTSSYEYLRDEVAALGAHQVGHIERRRFPDGEAYHRVLDDVADRHVVLVGGTISDADTLELYDLACALVRHGAQSLTLVIPYFGYSTMERAVRPGEVVKAKTRARLLSSIPLADAGNRVLLFDLHAEGIPHYFEGGMRPVHVYCKRLVLDAVHAIARASGDLDLVLACTDAGRAKWVESLANDLGVPAAFVFKRRIDGSKTAVSAVSAQVKDKDVILYDDMIRTGGSLVNAARAYREAGARRMWAIATHGVFPGDALAAIEASGLFAGVVATNSHPRARELASGFLAVTSLAGLVSEALAIHAAA